MIDNNSHTAGDLAKRYTTLQHTDPGLLPSLGIVCKPCEEPVTTCFSITAETCNVNTLLKIYEIGEAFRPES
jgi:hypothetical protein